MPAGDGSDDEEAFWAHHRDCVPCSDAAILLVAAGGTPAWQVARTAVAAALAAAGAAVVLDRVRAARRELTVTRPEQAQPVARH